MGVKCSPVDTTAERKRRLLLLSSRLPFLFPLQETEANPSKKFPGKDPGVAHPFLRFHVFGRPTAPGWAQVTLRVKGQPRPGGR